MRSWEIMAVAGAIVLCPVSAGAQTIVSALSEKLVSITSNFAGTTLTLSGNIEPDEQTGTAVLDGPYDIVTVVRGPLADRVVRLKTQKLGVWLNSEQVLFSHFPAYFRVLSNKPLAQITSAETLVDQGITPDSQTLRAADPAAPNKAAFSAELIRLMTGSGLYDVSEDGIVFLSRTFYTAHIDLPADVPNGRFVAQTFLFKGGDLVARRSDAFLVRTVGFEQFLGTAAHRTPLLYGLASAALAIFVGWLGGVLFRR